LRSLFADAAGVVENKGSGFDRIHLAVTAREKNARDFFGVVLVHLAAEGFEVKGSALGCASDKVTLDSCRGFRGDE